MKKYAFKKGWAMLRAIDQPKVKEEIKNLLNVNTDNSFFDRRKGKIEPKISEKESIEQIFIKYGVNKNDIWGTI